MALINLALLTGNLGKPGSRHEPVARPRTMCRAPHRWVAIPHTLTGAQS
jgi:anaerobic selenocysteine-containing dehydrogenase